MRYDHRARNTAARMLAPVSTGGKGQAVTITGASAGVYNPATGKTAGGETSSQTGSGLEDAYTAREIDGATIRAGDKRFMLSAKATDGAVLTMPEPGFVLEYESGSKWRIEAVEPYAPAGVAIYAMLQLRGV
jgi:hypothetical protein